MRKKGLLIIATVVALSAIMVISAATIFRVNINMNASVSPSSTPTPNPSPTPTPTGTVTIVIGTTTYTDGQTIDNFGWGTVHSGDNTQEITINNNRNEAVTPSIATTGLPTGWTLSLSNTNPILAGQSVQMNIVLHVPSDAASGSYSWTAELNVAGS
jgi:hypothetical protein